MAVKSPFATPQATAIDRENDARDLWDQSGQWVNEDRSRAATNRDTAAGAATAALAKYGATDVGANARAFTPTVPGYSPTQLQQWMSSFSGFGRPNISTGSGGGGVVAGGAGAAGSGSQLSKFSAKDVLDFDPSQAGSTYARGAMGQFKSELGDMLRDYDEQSVAAGRFRTGQYDVGKGQVITRLGNDFEDRLAQAAMTFSGQRLSALTSGTQMNLERASSMDANARALQELNANMGLERDKLASQNSLAFEEALMNRAKLGMEGAQLIDTANWNKAVTGDESNWRRASFLDTQTADRDRTMLDATLGRERTYLTDYNTQADRAAAFASSNRDWASRDRDAADLRAAIDRITQAMNGVQAKSANKQSYGDYLRSLGIKNVVGSDETGYAAW